MKTCSKCGNTYPATTEYWHRSSYRPDGLNFYCKPCNLKASSASKRRLVTDPTTGEAIKAGTLATRKLVTDPKTGETISANALSKRRVVTDPVTGEVITAGALACRKRNATPEGREKSRESSRNSCRKLTTDQGTGKVVTVSALRARKTRSTEEGRKKSNIANALSSQKRYETGKCQEYLDNNPLYKLRQRMSCLIKNSMRNKGWSKTTKTQALLGCSFQEFSAHIESQFKDGMSWENAGKWHYDHLIPCSSATTEDELNALQHWSNFQPLWGSENISKGASLPPDWKERKAKLMAIYWSRFPERREAA